MPYRDVGAVSQSMDSRQPKTSRRSVAVHNSFPTIDGRPILGSGGEREREREKESERGRLDSLFICSSPVKLGHRVARARKRPLLGWVDPFLGPSH
ncbi:hypothetical protein ALC62_10595 [Cyphomyrmex costatus]|uniref:Uncharacterized protein n=1 Tax=Cyphomyrmex costatus TaxID=456900 RepID=A0A195CCV3_9HYME|nr:hypothetical protein ALC62_10595 [Cyphomyrmex costatus]